jgi:hypothetical protein
MTRVWSVALLLLVSGGCQSPEKVPIAPLPENGANIPFADILQRARLQAGAATEAFYLNNWVDLETAAAGIDQAARLLPRATEVPPRHQDRLAEISTDLAKDADQLRQAAKDQDVKRTNETLQRINLMVRELRP